MKKIRSFLVLALGLVMVMAFAGCGSDKNSVSDLAKDFKGVVHDKLGVAEESIKEMDPGTFQNAHVHEGKYYVCNASDVPLIDCDIYDDANEARECFKEYYDAFVEAYGDGYTGSYQYCLKDDYGYIVVDGTVPGYDAFGSRFASGGEICAGIYYSDNAVIRIMPRNDDGESCRNAISRLGLPMTK